MGTESLWEPHTPVRSPPPPTQAEPTRRRWYRRPLGVVGLALALVLVAGLVTMYLASERLGDNVARVEAFGGLDDANRPPVTGALTFLLVGTDSRSEATPPGVTADGANAAAEVVMVARVAPDAKSATVVSIPGDSWVDVPDHGPGRLGGAYAVGGATLLVRTVEHLTDLRMDHVAVVDFAGFRSVVDDLGGIDLDAGHLSGTQALAYVRDRSGQPTGDRARRQQNALRAILARAASGDTLSDPVRLYDFLDAASHSVGVDETLSNGGMRALALRLRELRPAAALFLQAPVQRVQQDGAGALVRLDDGRNAALWDAVRRDDRDALGSMAR